MSSLPSRRSTLISELSDAMIRSGSRCVCTSNAFGYSSSSAPRHHRCPGDFSTQRGAGMPRLQVLQVDAVPPVRGRHVGFVDQPLRVRRHAVLRREDHAAEVAAGHAHALLRQPRAHRVHRLEAGDHELDAVEQLLRRGDARIGVVGRGLGRRERVVDLPRERHAVRGILREQVVQDRRAGARLADDHDRRHDVDVGDLGMLLAPLDEPEPGRRGSRRSRRPTICSPSSCRCASVLQRVDVAARGPSCHVGSPKSSRPVASSARRDERSASSAGSAMAPFLVECREASVRAMRVVSILAIAVLVLARGRSGGVRAGGGGGPSDLDAGVVPTTIVLPSPTTAPTTGASVAGVRRAGRPVLPAYVVARRDAHVGLELAVYDAPTSAPRPVRELANPWSPAANDAAVRPRQVFLRRSRSRPTDG